MDILEDLWNGKICPIEQVNDCHDEYRNLVALLARNEEKLLFAASPQQREDYQRIKDLWEEMGRIAECDAFAKGFRLAVRLVAASF